MYCEKCGTELNEQGICLKCRNLQENRRKSKGKKAILLLVISSIGLAASFLLGKLVFDLTPQPEYAGLFKPYNNGPANCACLIGILITIGIDVYILLKN